MLDGWGLLTPPPPARTRLPPIIFRPVTSDDFNPIFCIFIVHVRSLKSKASSEAVQLLTELFYTAANV